MLEIPPFNGFPFSTFMQVIEKLEYLADEVTPYEVSPGTDLCLSDTYYSLSFLAYLHSYGRTIKKNNKWMLDPIGEPRTKKPYRYKLIEDATEILKKLSTTGKLEDEIAEAVSNIDINIVKVYLDFLSLLGSKGKVVQAKTGWDASFILKEWASE
ncbi:MAG: hypothetical protein ACFFE8_08370 [Candidatus Heimdallarchaeota archaeon]